MRYAIVQGYGLCPIINGKAIVSKPWKGQSLFRRKRKP